MITNSGALAAVNNQVALNVASCNSAVLYVKGGTVASVGATVAFEASIDSSNGIDGTWFSINGARTNGNTVESTTTAIALNPGVGNAYGWRVNVSNVAWVRARLSAITSGDLVGLISGSGAMSETAPAIGTHAVTGSGSFTTAGTATTTPISATGVILVETTAAVSLTSQKATGGNLYELTVSNNSGAVAAVKLYNKATAPVVATDSPIVVKSLAVGETWVAEWGALGKRFTTGIAMAVTSLPAKTDATAPAAGVVVHGSYV